MAKIKFSKTELKTQRDALKRFTRFLPTLQLKKQQLQAEVMRIQEEIAQHDREEQAFRQDLSQWIALFSDAEAGGILDGLEITSIDLDTRNIAGVDVPVFRELQFSFPAYDLFVTSAWYEAAIEAAKDELRLAIRRQVLQEQARLLQEELRTTTQRVNLFEKVKIPESKENIRVIQIYLGDQQTAAVGRSKIAKNKLTALQRS